MSERPATLGEMLMAFSAVTSTGMGLGAEHGVRTCYLCMTLAADLELTPAQTADLYYASLAKDGGCVCGASQMATFLGGDEREAIVDMARDGPESELQMLRWLFRHAGSGSGPLTRARRLLDALVHGARFERENSLTECEVGQHVALRLGLGDEAAFALTACTERWDGKGQPGVLAGEQIPLTARIINLCAAVEIAERFNGRDSALSLIRQRAGKAFDPAIAAALLALVEREEVWAVLDEDADNVRTAVLSMEPPRSSADAPSIERLAEVIADLVDMRVPRMSGHSRRVQRIALEIGERMDIHAADRATLRRAALIHEVGQIALSAHALTLGVEDVAYRSHPLAAAQLLATVPELSEPCALAALHHERVDGSGWPAGAVAARQPMLARILALACALDERGLGQDQASAFRAVSAESGFDRAVLDACAEALGAPKPARSDFPSGLTAREVEVLRLGATGLSVREIGRRLVISHHTVRHHLESAYSKIGCTNRAAASLFAAEHGLLD
jgi:HD-GYP domain-containing protein (c-di-GMP phosphodiesterase class II)/DNA-binding CsgD family transcriptional regulator